MENVNRFEVEDFLMENNAPKRLVLEEFAQKKKSEVIFNAKFTAADQNGNMAYFVREGIVTYKILMLAEDRIGGVVSGDGRRKQRRLSLDKIYPVMVKAIDYEAKTVYISNRMARDYTKEKLVKSILDGIAEKRPIRTKAKIAFIRQGKDGEKFVELDLAGVGVVGYLFKGDWSTCYTADISFFAKVGDIVEVEVTEVMLPRKFNIDERASASNHKFIFKCSRKNAIDYNPWEGVSDRYPVGSVVSITCVDKAADKFYAKIDGLDEVNALGFYPDDENKFNIRVGGRYVARIKKVDEEKKGLSLKPYKELL